MELLKEIMNLIIYVIITGCGVVVIKKVLAFINAKIDDVQASTKLSEYERLNAIIDQVQRTVTMIVISVNQVFVDDLKKSGQFTKEYADEAKNKALEMAKDLITEESADAIEQVYCDIDLYLDNLVESIIKELKK